MDISRPNTNTLLVCEKSFAAFFREHYASFCFFANRIVQDPQESEDIVSEVAIRIWENKERLRNPAALKNYFYTSIRNAALRALANQERRSNLKKDLQHLPPRYNSNLPENLIRTEVMQALELVFHQLSPQCRKVFHLFIDGKSIQETAAELEVSPNTIKFHRKQGIKLLRKFSPLLRLMPFLHLFLA